MYALKAYNNNLFKKFFIKNWKNYQIFLTIFSISY